MTTKVRFHLGRGPNYQRWQVRFGDNPPEYFDPEDVILKMHNAVLRNQRGTAEKILNGENKTVCAWVECDHLEVRPRGQHYIPGAKQFCHYNPKRRAHWFNNNRQDIDNTKHELLATFGKLIIIPEYHEDIPRTEIQNRG
tara:strand:+ start:1338 stop:1757 length:420 start_codon:yes stop_codon:yes gene_type:complete